MDDFFNINIMSPMKWRVYSDYRIATVDTFITEVLPLQSARLIELLKKPNGSVSVDSGSEPSPVPALDREIIYPVPGSSYREYNPWDYLHENILAEFTALWKNGDPALGNKWQEFTAPWKYGDPPSDEELLCWINKYGLPCKEMASASMLADWNASLLGFNFLSCLSDANYLSQMIDSFNCDPEIDPPEGFDEVIFLSRHAMHKELMLDFLKELCFSIDLIEALLSGNPASFPAMNDEIQKFIDTGDYSDRSWCDKDSIASYNMAAWQRLRELMSARLSGTKLTIRAKKLPAFPYMELRHAFESEDLLSVFWGKTYNLLLSKGPIRRCECGEVFKKTRSNQTYCTPSCQKKINQRNQTLKKDANTPLEPITAVKFHPKMWEFLHKGK